MANEEQVALLKQGSEVWNRWREENPDVAIDLSHVNLPNANLRDVNLRRADLREAYLEGAFLSDALLMQADLSHAELSHALLFNTDLRDANLSLANLSYSKLIYAQLSRVDLRETNLSGADLSSADLSLANFSDAALNNLNLSGVILKNANLRRANLHHADLSRANLSNSDLSDADLSRANLSNSDLRDADLSRVKFSGADLSYVNLSGLDLSSLNLSDANLNSAQVLRTNFTEAMLTGACISDWQIGSSTVLEGVKCDYIFRTYDTEKKEFSGRLPVDPDSTFALGEFTQRFQIIASALETIDITFTEGINWQAFFQSFQQLRDSHPDEEISIQGMERKDNAFVVRLEVEAEVDKGAIETEVKQLYAHQLAALEAQYEERLRLQGAHLEDIREILSLERQERTRLTKVVETMANEQKAPKIQINHSNIGNLVDTAQSGSRVQSIQHIYAPEQQDLSEAAQEIQKLLNTLAETYNTTSETGQAKLMKELSEGVEKHPKWRRALKEGGIELIKVLFAPIGIPLEMARVYLEDDE